MNSSKALTNFQSHCQELYTCFFLAERAIRINYLQMLDGLVNPEMNPNADIMIGSGHPDEGNIYSSMKTNKVIEYMNNGKFSDILYKSFIIRIYSDWDEKYRCELAKEFKRKKNDIKCDLMGDIRIIRNWIVHKSSIIGSDYNKLKDINWNLAVGEHLIIDSDKSSQIMDKINRMCI